MVTEKKRFVLSEERWVTEFEGLSSDEKPSGKLNGSKFHEIDTGKDFRYDETTDTWYLQE